MTTSLPVSDIVTVAISVAPSPPQARGFGTALILGTSAVLPLYDRLRVYTALAGGVDADFASNTAEYKAAAAYFSQSPAPARLMIGRQFTAAQVGTLRGGTASAVYTDYTGITNGGFDITINAVNRQIFALDFSAQTTMAGIAGVIQTKLAAALAGTTCVWDATYSRFIIQTSATGVTAIVSFAVAPTGGSSPTNQSSFLKFTANDGAQSTNGIAIETVTAAWTASRAWNAGWYGMLITSTTAQDSKDSMAYAQANKCVFFDCIADANAMDSTATSDLAYYAKNQGYDHTLVLFDNVNSDKFLCASAMAKMFAVDYTQPNSFIILKFKTAPGYAPISLTETQRLALEAKNCNYYTNFGDVPMFANGTVGTGTFIDEVIGLDWLQANIQNSVFTALYTAPTKIPQTDGGAVALVSAVGQALEAARIAGLLAEGIWTGTQVGQIKTGDVVQKGYYVVASAVSTQSAADRAARKAPPISAIGIGAGAIQSAAIQFTFQR